MTIFYFSILASLSIVPALHSMENAGRESFATKGNNEIVSYDNRGPAQRSNYASLAMIDTTHQGLIPHGTIAFYTHRQRTSYTQNTSPIVDDNLDQSSRSNTPLMSESTAEFARANIKRLKKIKSKFSKKGFFVTDEAAIYLSEKTTKDSKEELDGFIEAISDQLRHRQATTLDYDLAQEAVITRKFFAEKFKNMGTQERGYELAPVLKSFQAQYKNDQEQNKKAMDEIKEMLTKNQQTNIMPYAYATLISGGTLAACSLAVYKMRLNDSNVMTRALDVINLSIKERDDTINMLIKANKEIVEAGGKVVVEGASSAWKSFAGGVAGTVAVKSAFYLFENPAIVTETGKAIVQNCSIQ